MGKNPEPSRNEPNQNPGYAKNRTNPKVIKYARTLTEAYPLKNGTEAEPKCPGSYSVLTLGEIV